MNTNKCPKCGCFLNSGEKETNESNSEPEEYYYCTNKKCDWKEEYIWS